MTKKFKYASANKELFQTWLGMNTVTHVSVTKDLHGHSLSSTKA